MVCKMVLLDAICVIIPSPMATINSKERINMRDNEKAMSPKPKIAADKGIIFHSPNTLFLEARYTAPIKAPSPEAPMRKPKVCDPP